VHLTPRELDKLVLHGAGVVAQKRLARGLRLSYPEAIALIATVLLERIRDGASVAELMDEGRRLLGRAQVMPGVAELVKEVQVEGTFPDGTKLVTVHAPIAAEEGDLEAALYGSFLPVPDASLFVNTSGPGTNISCLTPDYSAPGAVEPAADAIEINAGRRSARVAVVHRGDRPIQVGSHYPFDQVNGALEFDRAATAGMRLDIPAGTAVRFEPGVERDVDLVETATSPEAGVRA
jgi:urease subunit gamma/beta